MFLLLVHPPIKVSHHWRAKVRNKSSSWDAKPPPAHPKGRWGSSLFRSRWKLHQGLRVVQEKDAAFISGADYNRQVNRNNVLFGLSSLLMNISILFLLIAEKSPSYFVTPEVSVNLWLSVGCVIMGKTGELQCYEIFGDWEV